MLTETELTNQRFSRGRMPLPLTEPIQGCAKNQSWIRLQNRKMPTMQPTLS